MKDQIDRLFQIITQFPNEVDRIRDSELEFKPSPQKWSKKEILGHLNDSALNNIQRFVRVQYMELGKFVYQQDEWVRLQDHENATRDNLLDLWRVLNLQLVHIWKSIPVENLGRKCDIGKEEEQIMDMTMLARDYNDHLNHHIEQIKA